MKSLVVLLLAALLHTTAQAAECVNIYYDRSPDQNYWMGKTYSVFLQNLMGHFPEFQQIVGPIENYKKGDIEKCRASIYLGSYFNNSLPADFLQDYVNTSKNVAWVGYNIWQTKDDLEKIFGYTYSRQTVLDIEHKDAAGKPTYFKNIHYKGEVFFKFGDWSKTDNTQFLAPFEQTLLVAKDTSRSEVIATSEHNFTHEHLPYIIRAKNHFFVADIPFSFMHEADRYLVFADVLFDILNAKPRHNGKYAFVRVEDVHPTLPLGILYDITDAIRAENIPVNISLIPIFFDPLDRYGLQPKVEMMPMDRSVSFMSFIADMKGANANFIWHGVTHQYKNVPNPYEAISGSDFEFFDVVHNAPIVEDSPEYVINKLEDGLTTLRKAGVNPRIWLTPHYQASSLDYTIFANTFSWNVGRVIYYNHSSSGLNKSLLKPDATGDDPRLYFASNDPQSSELRHKYFADLKVQTTFNRWNGQFFPYEIFGDIHGQRILPENLGNSQPYIGEHISNPRSKEEIIAAAKRNLVLRDVWGSFFYHPFLLNSYDTDGRGCYPGDPSELQFILKALKGMGYQFIDLNNFIDKNTVPKRPEPIYTENAL